MAGRSDLAVTMSAIIPSRGDRRLAVLVIPRYGPMLVPAEEAGKNHADRQECKKADDDAVPLHDPEQGA
jgi:hypothetical protein